MIKRQKRMATHIEVAFEEAALRYSIRDNSGERTMTVDYAEIPSGSRRVFEKNLWLRNVGLIWVVLGAIFLIAEPLGLPMTLKGGFWIIIGGACLAFYRLTQTNYTVIDAAAGSIFVIEDKEAPALLDEISRRRRERLLALHGEADLQNDPEREVQKFEWLVREAVMDRAAADKRIAAVRANAAGRGGDRHRTVH